MELGVRKLNDLQVTKEEMQEIVKDMKVARIISLNGCTYYRM